MKIKLFITLLVLAIIIFVSSVFSINTYNKIKTQTMPEIESQSFEDFAVNIANSLMEGRGFPVPDELLNYVIGTKLSQKSACYVSESDSLKIVIRENIDKIGEVDISLDLSLVSFENQKLALKINSVYLGNLKVPEFFVDQAIKFVSLKNDDFYIDGDNLYIEIDCYDINFLGAKLSIGIESLYIDQGQMYVKFFSEAKLEN